MQYYDAALDSYGTIGPMGSNHSLIYLSAAEIHSKLNDPTCPLRRDFEKNSLEVGRIVLTFRSLNFR